MAWKFAVMGLRHGHIRALIDAVDKHPDATVVAVCEEDAVARDAAKTQWNLACTHTSLDAMLADAEFDVLAVGDYYARRGALALAGLKAGKHVIADKPLCTRMAELDAIAAAAGDKLKVGLMLDLRDNATMWTAKRAIDDGLLGDLRAVQFGGQHPLLLGSRPGWYFEPGKHGGTFTDIAIHAIDMITWLSGQPMAGVDFARVWTAGAPGDFEDGAQCAFRLENGAGVLGDVSYFAPDACGYGTPYYWRFTLWGAKGVMEFNATQPGVRFYASDKKDPVELPTVEPADTYLTSFLGDLDGKKPALDSARVLDVTRWTLQLQQAAETAR